MQEIDALLKYKPEIIKFVDRSFNGTPDRARAIWRALAAMDTGVRFHFEVHPALLEAGDLELLRTVPADRFQFEVGLQSFHEPALRAVSRAPLSDSKMRLLKSCAGSTTFICIAI
jgi:coproporphyrinogen III oxidase-like Fe-S oxidoreductase